MTLQESFVVGEKLENVPFVQNYDVPLKWKKF